MNIIKKIFGSNSQREIKRILPIVEQIEALEEQYKKMTDEELKETTPKLKARLAAGETLDDILPDAFAAVREVNDRLFGQRLFRVQLIGGIILHQGRIAEMKTGEGKTQTATLVAYLNALSGNGVHIVTVNEYLAKFQSEWMGKVYRFLGLTVGLVTHGQADKRTNYEADITYGTNNEFGFDYLRDNMVTYKEQMAQRGQPFAIVDEVDSILIDEARTPLIISGVGEKSTDLYERANKFAASLQCVKVLEEDRKTLSDDADGDYIVDEKAKTATLTKRGIEKAELFFKIDNLSDSENTEISHHINQAIKAHGIMKRDIDYVVKDNEIIIVDEFTGRLMLGRRYSLGLHQAIEAKEHVKVQNESKTLATITFQNYFRLYKKLSGMTGTAMTEEEEFQEIYGLDVVEIPTNRPMIRIDHDDEVYTTEKGKFNAVIKQIEECHAKGQPVLVGTVSIEKSELLSKMLKQKGIPHSVLNAKQHEREAEIVAQAGKVGTVTIATNMAGRGTDILLGGNSEFLAKNEMRKLGFDEDLISEAYAYGDTDDEEILNARQVFKELNAKFRERTMEEAKAVRENGGLFIIGTERHESRRIDNQLRGRAGRQGDPGESRFYISFEDDLMRLFGGERAQSMVKRLGVDEETPIAANLLSKTIENAQKRVESRNFETRKHVLQYDDVMNKQRELIYGQRMKVIDGENLREYVMTMLENVVDAQLAITCAGEIPDNWNLAQLKSEFLGIFLTPDDLNYNTRDQLEGLTVQKLREELLEKAHQKYDHKEEELGERMRELERVVLLQMVDRHWMDHIDAMDELRNGIGLRGYAQRDPVVEYRFESYDMFDEMTEKIKEDTIRGVFTARLVSQEELVRRQVAKPTSEGYAEDESKPAKKEPVHAGKKVGRNDPCPCGSGKKYKKCCGADE